jgi:hypothetical protein
MAVETVLGQTEMMLERELPVRCVARGFTCRFLYFVVELFDVGEFAASERDAR